LAMAGRMADVLLELAERPDAPNLYWSLAALPRPLIDLRDGFELEQRVVEVQFPDLADLDRPRTAEQWDLALKQLREMIQRLYSTAGGPNKEAARSEAEELAQAKKFLTETRGLKASEVEAMPRSQVLLLSLLGQYRQYSEDWYKATYLPYAEARPVMAAADQRLQKAPAAEGVRFARALLPGVNKCVTGQARLDRTVAVLRVVEALRLH